MGQDTEQEALRLRPKASSATLKGALEAILWFFIMFSSELRGSDRNT